MSIDRFHLIIYVYTAAVFVSGIYIERTFSHLGHYWILAMALGISAVWVAYYHVAIKPRVEGDDSRSDS